MHETTHMYAVQNASIELGIFFLPIPNLKFEAILWPKRTLIWNLAKLHLKLTKQHVSAKNFWSDTRFCIFKRSARFTSFSQASSMQKRLSGMFQTLTQTISWKSWMVWSFGWTRLSLVVCWGFEAVRLLPSYKTQQQRQKAGQITGNVISCLFIITELPT